MTNNDSDINNEKNHLNSPSDREKDIKKIYKIFDSKFYKDHICHFFLFLISLGFIIINVLLFIHTILMINKNRNNKKKLNILNDIESDEFIQSFINEFRKKCQIGSLMILAIIFLGLDILIFIIGFVFVFIIIFLKRSYIFLITIK